MKTESVERVRMCIVLDRMARDNAIETARYLKHVGAGRQYVCAAVKSARIASRTAVQRSRYLRTGNFK